MRWLAFVPTMATSVVVLVLRATFPLSRTSTMMRLCVPLTMLLTACQAAPPAEPLRQEPTAPAVQGAGQAGATAAPASPKPQDELATQVDAYLEPMVADGKFSGSVLLARDGEVLVRKGYGTANLEHDIPNTPQTKFRLGSVTKQFTAMGILLLQQQGKLTVSDHICLYIPKCPDAWQEITIHHLLTHTSGIRNVTDMPDYQKIKTQPATPIQTMALFRDTQLLFTPCSSYSYSNSGYIVLGYIIETVAKQVYPLFLRQEIFKPLDLLNTGYETSIVLKQRASGYTSGGAFNANYIDMSVPHAAGGLYSTVEDLYRWDQALYTERLVPKAALDTMFTPHAAFPPPGDGGYGYGWDIFEEEGRRVVGHLGGIEGFSAGITRFPDDKTVIIVLSNLEQVDVGKISLDLAKMIFKQR